MSIFCHISKHLRPFCQFIRLKCHRLAPCVQIFTRDVCHAKHLGIPNDRHLQFQYYLSRSYCSQPLRNFKIVADTLNTLSAEQIESSECKNIVLGLVSFYFDLEEGVLQKKDQFMVLLEEYKISEKSNDFENLQQYQKHISKFDGFQKLLKVLPSHIESMRLKDVVDVFGGLLLLGVAQNSTAVSQCIYRLLNPNFELGLLEIAKLSAIFHGNFQINSRHILQYTLLAPALKSLLVNFSSCDRNDLIYLSYLMEQPWIEIYPEVMNRYLEIISDALENNNLHQDVDCMLSLLNGVCECIWHQNVLCKQSSPHLLGMFRKLMEFLDPCFENLTYEQVSTIFSNMNNIFSSRYKMAILKVYPDAEKTFLTLQTQLENQYKFLLHLNLPIRERFRHKVFEQLLSTDNGNEMPFHDMIPQADELTLQSIVHRMNAVVITDKMIFSVMNQLLKLLRLRSKGTGHGATNNQKYPYYTYISILADLQKYKQPKIFEPFTHSFKPYLSNWLESGYACDIDTYSQLCEVAIPLFGRIRKEMIQKIRNILLSLDVSQFQYAGRFFQGALKTVPSNTLLIKIFEKALATNISQMKHGGVELIGHPIMERVPELNTCLVMALEKLENGEEYFLRTLVQNGRFITEKMANRILENYADNFNTKYKVYQPDCILLHLLLTFNRISRLPKNLSKLEELANCALNTHLNLENDMQLLRHYQILNHLCHFGIYLDEHIRKAFSSDFLKKFYEALEGKKEKFIALNLASLVLMNRHIVLHRKDLNIPWKCEQDMKTLSSCSLKEKIELGLINRMPLRARKFYYKLKHDGAEHIKVNFLVDYGIHVHLELCVDSQNMPVDSQVAKKDGFQKRAVVFGILPQDSAVVNDKTAISASSAQQILDLRALGYEVLYVPYSELIKSFDKSDGMTKSLTSNK
ncbi:hypothetical protein KUTeg_010936 [Tegillarca granosa]|uniref:RAP domain-containing protein n=1 Tax=Tegillarca granosa TaxID=220873 RepID=A0ABQ9F4S7_TEGGR|nr:hypothetical protein KUTeg_010936 [Tegillarca granosa]